MPGAPGYPAGGGPIMPGCPGGGIMPGWPPGGGIIPGGPGGIMPGGPWAPGGPMPGGAIPMPGGGGIMGRGAPGTAPGGGMPRGAMPGGAIPMPEGAPPAGQSHVHGSALALTLVQTRSLQTLKNMVRADQACYHPPASHLVIVPKFASIDISIAPMHAQAACFDHNYYSRQIILASHCSQSNLSGDAMSSNSLPGGGAPPAESAPGGPAGTPGGRIMPGIPGGPPGSGGGGPAGAIAPGMDPCMGMAGRGAPAIPPGGAIPGGGMPGGGMPGGGAPWGGIPPGGGMDNPPECAGKIACRPGSSTAQCT